MLDLGENVRDVSLGIGVEVVRVGPPDAEGREEPVKILEVADGLAGENEVGALQRVVVRLGDSID